MARCIGEVMAPREPGQQYTLAVSVITAAGVAVVSQLSWNFHLRRIDLQGRKAAATSRISTNPLTLKASELYQEITSNWRNELTSL